MKYKHGGTCYGVSIGRVRIKEGLMFNKSYLFSLAEARSSVEVIEMLAKTNYAKYLTAPPEQMDYRKMLEEKWRSVRNMYRQFALKSHINFFLWSKYDLYDAKILLKSRYFNLEPKELSGIGTVNLEKLKRYILRDLPAVIPGWIVKGVVKVKEKLEASKDSKYVDLIMDKEYLEFLKRVVSADGNGFLKDLLAAEIDLYNIKTFLRLKTKSIDPKILEEALAAGGSKSKSFFVNLLGATNEEIVSFFKNTSYGSLINDGMVPLIEKGRFWKIEKLADDYLLKFVRGVKHNAFGFEPLIAYVYARRNEEKALRSIIEGKLTGMSAAHIKERIPEAYV
ncbi:MAG: V-type ATPase subunit [bacterium]